MKYKNLTIDGKDVKDFTIKSLRENISMVFQDNFLYSETVKENIMMVNPNASSAAPTYFKSYSISRPTDKALNENFADGGLFANNPSSCALIEAIKYNSINFKNIKLLSIGTSNSDKRCFSFKTKNGLIKSYTTYKYNIEKSRWDEYDIHI